jgi:hypothetical protein
MSLVLFELSDLNEVLVYQTPSLNYSLDTQMQAELAELELT